MKIRKFNESINTRYEYITQCFIDMIDESKIRFYTKNNKFIGTSFVPFKYGSDNEFDSYREYYIECNKLIDIVELCVDKVLIEYPDIQFSFSIIGNIMEIKFE